MKFSKKSMREQLDAIGFFCDFLMAEKTNVVMVIGGNRLEGPVKILKGLMGGRGDGRRYDPLKVKRTPEKSRKYMFFESGKKDDYYRGEMIHVTLAEALKFVGDEHILEEGKSGKRRAEDDDEEEEVEDDDEEEEEEEEEDE